MCRGRCAIGAFKPLMSKASVRVKGRSGNVQISLGENCCRSLLELKELNETAVSGILCDHARILITTLLYKPLILQREI